MKKLTTKEFIEKAKKIHGDKYDYSLVEYKNCKTKVKIICTKHGVFEQRPTSHYKSGCPICIGRIRNIQDVLNKFQNKHGDKYDYSLVKYKNGKTKVKIICTEHGIFEQEPNNHLQGQKCPKCSLKENVKRMSSNNFEFIKKSKETHGDKYDYSLVNYKRNKNKVKIICKIHGEFEQFPQHHMKGSGCYKCNGGYQLSTEDFIAKSNKIHNNKYDYSVSNYTKAKNKIDIICPIHGIFSQQAFSHSKGVGCPKCNGGSNLKYNNKNKYLYLFLDEKTKLIKIGSSYNPEKRLKVISKYDGNLILLKSYEKCSYLERNLHKEYEKYKTIHTLYEDGKTEWFKLTNEQINDIEKYVKESHN